MSIRPVSYWHGYYASLRDQMMSEAEFYRAGTEERGRYVRYARELNRVAMRFKRRTTDLAAILRAI